MRKGSALRGAAGRVPMTVQVRMRVRGWVLVAGWCATRGGDGGGGYVGMGVCV